MHDKSGLNSSRNLVGVRHNTTDEVRLSLIQGGHQVIKLALEIGGHSLATLTLLSILVLGCFRRLTRVISEALDGQRVTTILD